MIAAPVPARAYVEPATCVAYRVAPTPAERAADAALVARGARQPVSAGAVGAVMAGGGWRIVRATPADSEPGVFFFRDAATGPRLVDTWGGVTGDERGAARWARGLGAPAVLARCFAHHLVTEGP